MATMFPEIFPRRADQEDPEYVMYDALKKLPESYTVFYSKRFTSTLMGKPECEIDFIIFNQHDVFICLEVKGGLLAYNGTNDVWFQNGKPMAKSPERQASEASHMLLREMEHELRNVNVDWALCFPQCVLASGVAPPGFPLSRIIDESHISGLQREIEKLENDIRQRYKKPGLNPQGAADLVKRMTRNMGFVQILGVRIARESNQLLEVTEEQFDVLRELEINSRVLVHGAAGTGKTILAQELAKRFCLDGKSVLLLFYNKGIAEKVRRAFERRSGVQVATFFSFAKRIIQSEEPEWLDKQTHKDASFWELAVPSRLLDISNKNLPSFDAVIVDEGQDFKPEWYEFLLTLVNPSPKSHFCVFLDEHQDIFGHWKSFPSDFPPAKKLLSKNCRNTKTIVDFLKANYPVHMSYFDRSPKGVPVVSRTVRNEIEEQTQLVRDIKHLLNNEQIKPGNIVILLNCAKEDSCLAQTKAIEGIPLVSTYTGYDPRSNQIHYATIDIFKGLEADVVFLLLGKSTERDAQSQAIYVRGSRAKHLLYVYSRADQAKTA
jgi:adenylate kinase family enzyme